MLDMKWYEVIWIDDSWCWNGWNLRVHLAITGWPVSVRFQSAWSAKFPTHELRVLSTSLVVGWEALVGRCESVRTARFEDCGAHFWTFHCGSVQEIRPPCDVVSYTTVIRGCAVASVWGQQDETWERGVVPIVVLIWYFIYQYRCLNRCYVMLCRFAYRSIHAFNMSNYLCINIYIRILCIHMHSYIPQTDKQRDVHISILLHENKGTYEYVCLHVHLMYIDVRGSMDILYIVKCVGRFIVSGSLMQLTPPWSAPHGGSGHR